MSKLPLQWKHSVQSTRWDSSVQAWSSSAVWDALQLQKTQVLHHSFQIHLGAWGAHQQTQDTCLEISEWRWLGPTNRFCVLPNTYPGTSWLTRPMTTILTSELDFSFQMPPLLMGVDTLWWETFSNWGLRSPNLSLFSCPTPIEDQTDNSLQDHDISVASINHKPASLIFKRKLNIIKYNPFISMKCTKSEITWPKSPFV